MVVPTFRLWVPVTYDIDARPLVLAVEKWTSVPLKKNPMLRDIVRLLASNTLGRSVLASRYARSLGHTCR